MSTAPLEPSQVPPFSQEVVTRVRTGGAAGARVDTGDVCRVGDQPRRAAAGALAGAHFPFGFHAAFVFLAVGNHVGQHLGCDHGVSLAARAYRVMPLRAAVHKGDPRAAGAVVAAAHTLDLVRAIAARRCLDERARGEGGESVVN